MNKPSNHNSRIGRIGASDVGALMGYNPWSSPANQTAVILGLIKVEETLRMRFGKTVQPLIAEMVMEKTGLYALEDEKTLYHPKYAWMQATPDFIVGDYKDGLIRNGMPLELKFVGEYVSDKWGEDGDPDGVPPYVALQCVQQANLLQKDKVMVAALIGGHDLRIYPLEIRERDVHALEVATVSFYEKWIKPGVIPPVDYRDLETMKRLYPDSTPNPVTADKTLLDLIDTYVIAKNSVELLKQESDTAKAKIQAVMKEFDTILNDKGDPLITWKKGKDGEKTDWRGLAQLIGSEMESEKYLEYFNNHTEIKIGSRSFLTKKAAKREVN